MPHRFVFQLAGDWEQAAHAWSERGNNFWSAIEQVSSGDHDARLQGVKMLDELCARGTLRALRPTLATAGITVASRDPDQATRENPAELTLRQVEVLQLLAEGLSNPEIAQRLVVSRRTVDHHVSAILGKLQGSTREEAAERAFELGAVRESD